MVHLFLFLILFCFVLRYDLIKPPLQFDWFERIKIYITTTISPKTNITLMKKLKISTWNGGKVGLMFISSVLGCDFFFPYNKLTIKASDHFIFDDLFFNSCEFMRIKVEVGRMFLYITKLIGSNCFKTHQENFKNVIFNALKIRLWT